MISWGMFHGNRIQTNLPAAVLTGPTTGTCPSNAEVDYVLR
jgi:hypothetical protein